MVEKRVWAEIDLDKIKTNLLNVRAKLSENTKLCAVIKANGYGHGSVQIAKYTEDIIDTFAVATIEEALQLRGAGIKCDILILGYLLPCFYESAIENSVTMTVFSKEDAKNISECAKKIGKKAKIHIALDTGMGRIGFDMSGKSVDTVLEIVKLENVFTEGIFTHFATADEENKDYAMKQKKLFDGFCKSLEENGINIPMKHIANSAGIMEFDFLEYDMARCGIITYGLYPSDEVIRENLEIFPAMEIKTHIAHKKVVNKGTCISYGATYKAEKEKVIFTIPVGYADGYPRLLSNCGRVLINGKSAPIVGRVCMDQFMVDGDGIDANVGDEVILLGKSGEEEITTDEIAKFAGTINYEITCGISGRVPRIYKGENINE